MRSVNDIRNIGKDKNCLIIGGGLSVNNFDFSKLPNDYITIAVNNALPKDVRIDYIVYNDANFLRIIKDLNLNDHTKVIGSDSSPFPGIHYYFRNEQISCLGSDNTGLRALMIARDVFCCKEIYLIGFDFHTRIIKGQEQSHFYGDKFGKTEKYPTYQQVKDHFKRLNVFIEQFDRIQDISNIYNCYEESSLKKFPYKLPY